MLTQSKISGLKSYLQQRQDVLMAFLFGSFVKGKQTEESDLDIAIYIKTEGQNIEVEQKRDYPEDISDLSTENLVLEKTP